MRIVDILRRTKCCVIRMKEVKQTGCQRHEHVYVRMDLGMFGTVHGRTVKILKQRLTDCRWQCLDDHIQTSERFSF